MHFKLFFASFFFFVSIQYNVLSQTAKGVKQFGNEKGIVYDFCFSKNGTVIFIPEENSINVYNTETQKLIKSFSGGHSRSILSIDISPDSTLMVTGGKDSLITVWDLNTNQIIKKLDYHKGVVTDLKFSPTKDIIASCSSDNTVMLYDLSCDTAIFCFKEHLADVIAIDFNSDGTVLASAGEDKIIIFSSTISGEIINTITEHKGIIRDIGFNKDGSRFISCDDDSKIFLWKTDNLKKITKLNENKTGVKWILSAKLSESGSYYACGGIKGKIIIKTNFEQNTINVKKIIYKIDFIPMTGNIIKVAVATLGRGVLMIDTSIISNDKI